MVDSFQKAEYMGEGTVGERKGRVEAADGERKEEGIITQGVMSEAEKNHCPVLFSPGNCL